jgi:kynurenine 3-monooxygenase
MSLEVNESPDRKYVIVGGGLAGALMAVHLGQAGCEVDVYEMRGDMRTSTVAAGRSINLALSHRGLCALEEVGLADEILKLTLPMRGRMIHSTTGELAFQPYGIGEAHVIRSISRSSLNMALLDAAARHPKVNLFFQERCTQVDVSAGIVEFTHMETNEKKTIADAVVIGADGAYSAVRSRMQRQDRFDYRQDYLGHGYKELNIPPAPDGGHRLDNDALHIWPRRSFMMIALPNLDGSFTCTLFFALDGAESFAALQTPADVTEFFERVFPDVVPLMPTLVDDYFKNPTGSLVTIRCSPWHARDRIVLLGDAAHAVVPFYGQGMNAAFEDCIVLRECLEHYRGDRQRAFEAYARRRKPNTDALAELALANFIEMRDHTGQRGFRWKKKAEAALHRLFPTWFIPLYTLVTFTRTPYAEAARRAKKQQRIVWEVVFTVLLILILAAIVAT